MGGRRDQYGSLQREEESCEDDNNAAGSDGLRIDSGKKHKNKKPVVEEEEEENYLDSESQSGSDPVSESDENDRRSRRRSGKRERKSRKRHSRSRSRSYDLGSDSESDSGSGSEQSGSEIDSESEEERRRKRKERKRRREREEEKRRRREKEKRKRKEREEEEERRRKKRKKKKKEKEKKKREKVERGKTGAVTNSWGKYGIIRETDMWNKRPEFTAWLAEVKQVNLEHLANWEEKQMFKEFMEDHNTATFPSKKYYNLDAYYKRQMEKEMKKGTKNVKETERTVFNDEEQRRQELLRDREKQKEAEVEALKLSMRSGMAQAMKEQAQLREQMAYLYKLGKFEEAAAIQRRLDPDVPM